MKKFDTPEIEIIKFRIEDIITNSNEFPITPFAINEDELEIAKID